MEKRTSSEFEGWSWTAGVDIFLSLYLNRPTTIRSIVKSTYHSACKMIVTAQEYKTHTVQQFFSCGDVSMKNKANPGLGLESWHPQMEAEEDFHCDSCSQQQSCF